MQIVKKRGTRDRKSKSARKIYLKGNNERIMMNRRRKQKEKQRNKAKT
jgi:hypothetical protein